MKMLKTSEDIKNMINDSKICILYFTGMKCSACEIIKYKIEDIAKKYPNIVCGEVNGENNEILAAEYNAFALPICIVFTNGKESIRTGKNVDILEFERSIDRYYNMMFE